MSNIFQKVYPFTTENIAGYFPILKLENKSVLTVGSSADQALNALLLGASRVVLYDINPNTYEYLKLKKEMILGEKRENIYKRIISQKIIPQTEELFSWRDVQNMNPYLHDDSSYEKLQQVLKEKEIEFKEGNIFTMEEALSNEQFDRIIFSNILQYLPIFIKDSNKSKEEFLKENFEKWLSYLKEDGIIQLLYYYGINNNLNDYIETSHILNEYILYLQTFSDFQGDKEDGIVTYQKRRKD